MAALLRTRSFRALATRAEIEIRALLNAVDLSDKPSFDDCERAIRSGLAERGIEFLSQEHRDTVQMRPIDPAIKKVFDSIIERPGQFLGTAPLRLLRDLLVADAELARRVSPFGLTTDSLAAADRDE